MKTPVLNLHISYLPWNRGANPNFWSFVENTKKGVTIHEIDEKLDKGKILLRKELEFDENREADWNMTIAEYKGKLKESEGNVLHTN